MAYGGLKSNMPNSAATLSEHDQYSNSDIDNVPAKCLNITIRKKLAWRLNPQIALLSRDTVSRDYRGLAELMKFSYDDIINFERSQDPALSIFESWSMQPNATIGMFKTFLQKMGRYDIIEDFWGSIEDEAREYLHKQKMPDHSYGMHTFTAPEVSLNINSYIQDPNIITRDDANSGEYTIYDAFICYTDSDYTFAYDIVMYLENKGFKCFFRIRDMLVGHQAEYETNLRLIQDRCKRVIVIISPNFLESSECQLQASFATGLGIDDKTRKIVPIIKETVEKPLPVFLKLVSKLDFSKPEFHPEWSWNKLVSSLRDTPMSIFPSTNKNTIQSCIPTSALLPHSTQPQITFPTSSSDLRKSFNSLAIATHTQTTDSKMSTSVKSSKWRWLSPKGSKKNSTSTANPQVTYENSNSSSGFHSGINFAESYNSDNSKKTFNNNNNR